MKKIILLVILLVGIVAGAEENIIELKVGFSPSPKYNVVPSKKAEPSYEISSEYRKLVTNNIELGVGIAYQNHGNLEKFTNLEDSMLRTDIMEMNFYDSIPLYGTLKYNFVNKSKIIPYIKSNFGYSFNINKNSENNYETYDKIKGILIDSGKLRDFKAENGLYYSFGLGLNYKQITTELSYQMNRTKVKATRFDGVIEHGNANNERITLGFGYSFGF